MAPDAGKKTRTDETRLSISKSPPSLFGAAAGRTVVRSAVYEASRVVCESPCGLCASSTCRLALLGGERRDSGACGMVSVTQRREGRTLRAEELREARDEGQILNAGSCLTQSEARVRPQESAVEKVPATSPDAEALSLCDWVPGSVAVIVVPPSLIPLDGFFRKEAGIRIGQEAFGESGGELAAGKRYTEQGTLYDGVPIACLLTKSGTLVPYIGKEVANALAQHLFGNSPPTEVTQPIAPITGVPSSTVAPEALDKKPGDSDTESTTQ